MHLSHPPFFQSIRFFISSIYCIISFQQHRFTHSPWHFISLTRSNQFISLCANTDINPKNANIFQREVSASSSLDRSANPFPFSCDKAANPHSDVWGGWLRSCESGHRIDNSSCGGQTFSHSGTVLMTGSPRGKSRAEGTGHQQVQPSHQVTTTT